MSEQSNEDRAKTLLEYAEVFRLLLDSKRFVEFFELNYDLVKNTDPETGQTSILVIEKPDELVEQMALNKMKQEVRAESKRIKLATTMPKMKK